MYRLALVSIAVWFLGSAYAQPAEPKRPLYDSGFFEPSETVVTPHIAWAKPSAGAPRVLFITHRNAMREVTELAQRMSMTYKVFACDGPDKLGETGVGVDAGWRLIRGNSAEELTERLRADLAADYDVIVFGNVRWDVLPLDCHYEILKKVKAGTGLVGAMPVGDDPSMAEILKDSDFGWRWGLWSGAAQGVPDYFGVGVFDGSVDFAAAHSGKASLRIVGTEVKPGSREAPRAGYSPAAIQLEPNTEYVFSMWTKTQGLKDGGASVSLHPQPRGVPVPASDDWQYTEAGFKTDDKTLQTGVYLLNYSVGTVWYDDVKLTKAGDDKNLLPNPGFENPGPLPEDIAAGHPFRSLPAFRANTNAQGFLNSVLQVARLGEGRIGLLRYGPARHQMLTPGPSGRVQDERLEYDYYLALAIRLILWGARKELPVVVSVPDGPLISGDRAEVATRPLRFSLRAAAPKSRAHLSFAIRDTRNHVWLKADKVLDLRPGENAADLGLPRLPQGSYFADLWVKDGENIAGFGSIGLSLTSTAEIQEFAAARDSFALGEPLTGRAVLQNVPAGCMLRLKARDFYGRLVAQKEYPCTGGQMRFEVPMPPSLTIVGRLYAELAQGNEILDVRVIDYSISNLHPDHQDAEHVLWINYGNDFIESLMAEQFTQLGVDAQYGGGPGYAPYANQWWLPYATRFTDSKTDWYQPKPTRAQEDLVRDPCLTDPKYREKVRADLTKTAQAGLQYSTSDFTLGDENLFVSGNFDLCFSDTCVADFRTWAQAAYGSLDRLNAEWGSNYTSWDEVRPQTLEECKKTGNFVPWVDHRLHMESVWAGIHAFSRDAILQVVPNGRVGYEGSDTQVGSYHAADYWKLSRAMNLNNIYYRDFLSLVWHDFAAPGMLYGGGWYGGYAGCRNEPFMRWFPWRTLFKGANSFWVWQGYGDAGSVMAFDLSPYPFYLASCEEVAEIKSGPGKLLLTSERQHDGIALLYSAPSVHVATCTPSFPDMDATLNTMVRLLHDIGLECRVLSYAELAEGKLTNQEFKVLLLPCAQALSAAEADYIRKFVEAGGTLIADLRPGVTDEHGKPYPQPILDDLFSVKQSPTFTPVRGHLTLIWPPEPNDRPPQLGAVLADGSLQQVKAIAGGVVGTALAELQMPSGKGRAWLLNFSLNGYASVPKAESGEFADWPGGAAYRDYVRGLMGGAGVRAPVTVEPDAPHVEVSRFRRGESEYVGIVQTLPVDTILYTNQETAPPKPRPVTIHFRRPAHLYDVRAGKYLGESDTLKTEMTAGVASLYALLPYKVADLGIDTAREAKAGGRLAWRAKVHAPGAVGDHVLRLRVLGPDGKERAWYGRNLLAKGGEVSSAFTFALDDPPGAWKITVTDVASGVATSATVKLSG